METTVGFDLSVEQIRKILDPDFKGPLGALARRMSDNQLTRTASRLAGPTTVTVSDAGIRLVSGGSERQIAWSEVRSVNERAYAWALILAPSGLCMIPAEAVPAAQIPELGAQLRANAGSKYKVRDGGLKQQ